MSSTLTDPSIIPQMVMDLKQSFNSGKTLSLEWRAQQLNALLRLLKEGRSELCRAMEIDLHKAHFEGYLTEINMVESECAHALHHLKEWNTPEWKTSNLFAAPTMWSEVKHDPLGVVLVLGAWNYNVVLTLTPLVGAIAGGNCVMLKPGSYSPNVAHAMVNLVQKYMDNDCIKIAEGDRTVHDSLLRQKWDLIFCTGSGLMGRIVARAAAENLTPVILELGGKSPCIVDESCDIKTACKRILHTGLLNAGQTCVRPDNYFVHANIADKFKDTLIQTLIEFYGPRPEESEWFGRIVNEKAFKRLEGLIESSRKYLIHGGETKESARYIAPSIFDFGLDWNAFESAPLMKEEVFGPLIPMVRYTRLEDVISFINKRDKPLALYVFTSNSQVREMVKNRTSSGGLLVNDCALHLSNSDIPFGGVGESGMGRYHGKYSFDAFTHHKAVMVRPTWFGDAWIRYPPYSKFSQTLLEIFVRPELSLLWNSVTSKLDTKNALIASLVTYIAANSALQSGKSKL